MLTAQNAFNFSDSFNAMGKMLTTLKWKKQDTVPYMQYDLSYEIILIFIHWKKKDWKKMHQTFNCSYLCKVGQQDTKNTYEATIIWHYKSVNGRKMGKAQMDGHQKHATKKKITG